MNQTQNVNILQQCLDNIKQKNHRIEGFEESKLFEVPAEKYLNQEIFDKEVNKIYKELPIMAAHSSEVKQKGSFITLKLLGMPLIISRNESGEINTFLNICRHRGSLLETRSSGTTKKYICPYHSWQYDLNGCCINTVIGLGGPVL